MGQIYGIQNNLIQEIVYIGQTTRNYKIRWSQHKQQSKDRTYPLYNAFHKYGIDNFMPILIEDCDNGLLDEKEQYWIQYYHTSINEKGYNITLGGNTVSDNIKKPVHQYDLNGKYIQSFESINEAQWQIAHKAGSNIQKAVNHTINSAYGFLWSFDKVNQIAPLKNTYKKIIYQYDKDMNLIKEYDSVNIAAKALNKPPANISACALGKRKTAYGFIWSYNKEAGY